MKASTRRTRDGSTVRYLQLAHNEWDATARASRTKVLYSFGREDQLDRDAVRRLVAALSRLLDPADALADALAATTDAGLAFVESRPLGGAWLLDGLWRRLGIDAVMRRLLATRRLDDRVERVLFALVANRALKPSSKLAAAEWIGRDVVIDGLGEVDDDACYRAMDWLLEIAPALERAVYGQVADLLNLQVDLLFDLLFLDTTSTYFEVDEPDAPAARDERGQPVGDGDQDGDHGAPVAGFRAYAQVQGPP